VQFGFGALGRKREAIESAGMEDRMKARLMAALDNLAPQCQTPKVVRSLLMQKSRQDAIQRSGLTVALPYHSHLLLVQAKEMVALYQVYFWRVWAAFIIFATAMVGPFIINGAVDLIREKVFHYQTRFPFGDFLDGWNQAVRNLDPVMWQVSTSSKAIQEWAKQESIAGALSLIALALLIWCGVYMSRPNRLKIDQQGLTLSLLLYGITLSEQSLTWDSLVAISLGKVGETSPANWKINLHSKDSTQNLSLTLGSLGGNVQKIELLKAIDKYAAKIPVDAEVLSALSPASDNSFTELWLSSLASAPQREKLTPLNAGHTLKDGDYVIDAKQGAGGQGVTYLAHKRSSTSQDAPESGTNSRTNSGTDLEKDLEQESNLVIKETILPVYVDSQHRREAVEHFEKDARLLLRLDHHSLVKLCDYFIEDHRAYLVLDRIHGQNLRQLVGEQGPLAPSAVLDLAKQMCGMLIYLHEQDPEIIHRDFTPENLMLDPDGQLKLIDFGVAHEFKSRTTATVVGKHAYLPPEQFRGKPSTQSDLYALAGTLFFLLLGRDPEPLSRLNPQNEVVLYDQAVLNNPAGIEETILAILSRAIEHASELDPTKRTASASELLGELDSGSIIKIKLNIQTKDKVEIANG
jgi:serine/threonine protein kinase